MPSDASAPGVPLKSLPSDDLPREKLIRQGRAKLTDEELIAIFLRTGLQGCNVLELAARIKRSAGSLAALGRLEAAEISDLCKGIGPAKAATLAAVFELGQRAAREANSRAAMDSAAAVYNYFVDELRMEDQERMFVLLLNAKHQIIRSEEIGRGTLTRVLVHARDVYREAIRHSASCVVLVHNHPSGNPDPSKSDVQITQELEQASKILHIPLLDHIIIGAPGAKGESPYYSFREHGLLPSQSS